MAGLRSNRALNRTNRGIVDHDIMEGLPVRQWRKQPQTINPTPPQEPQQVLQDPTNRWKELPMPRGSELYTPMSQALLRAARRGNITKPHGENVDNEKEGTQEEEVEVEPETVFSVLRWTQVPKEQEVPELEFLAKRRKGLPSLVDGNAAARLGSVPMRKVRVRKVDANGNAAVYEALIPEGVHVDGEIVEEDTVMTEAPAPGTVVEGVGIANAEGVIIMASDQVMPTPPRRMPPRPKRKMKGPGRGRKKKIMVAPGTEAGTVEGGSAAATDGGLKVPDTNGEGASGSDADAGNESATREGEEGSEEDDEEGEEGEEGEISDAGPSRSVSKEPSANPAVGASEAKPATTLAAGEESSTAPAGAATGLPPLDIPGELSNLPLEAAHPPSAPANLRPQPPMEPPIITSPVLVSPIVPLPGTDVTVPATSAPPPAPPVLATEPAATSIDQPMIDMASQPQTVPQLDIPTEPILAPAEPSIPAGAVDVAAPASLVELAVPPVEAIIPPDHNPLEGLAEPTSTIETSATTTVESVPAPVSNPASDLAKLLSPTELNRSAAPTAEAIDQPPLAGEAANAEAVAEGKAQETQPAADGDTK